MLIRKKGFTLIELVLVLGIITILSVVAFPSYLVTRKQTYKKICINNLRQIDGAIDSWMFESGAPEDLGTPNAAQETEIYSYLKDGKPNCPGRGTYTIGAIGVHPQVTCSISGHELPKD